jgi:hypothetical protein
MRGDAEPDGAEAHLGEAQRARGHVLAAQDHGLVGGAAEQHVNAPFAQRRHLRRGIHEHHVHVADVHAVRREDGGEQLVQRIARGHRDSLAGQVARAGQRRRAALDPDGAEIAVREREDVADRDSLGRREHHRAGVVQPEGVALVADDAHGGRGATALADVEVDAGLAEPAAVAAEQERTHVALPRPVHAEADFRQRLRRRQPGHGEQRCAGGESGPARDHVVPPLAWR